MLGGERVPVSGRQRGDAPDIKHDWLSLEVKDRKRLPAWLHDAMAQAQASKRGDQLPAVILHEAGKRHSKDMVLMSLEDFKEWFGE